MSADAKLWQDDESGDWCGIHDGPCNETHRGDPYDMVSVIEEMNRCQPNHTIVRWELHVYPNGRAGLRGFGY